MTFTELREAVEGGNIEALQKLNVIDEDKRPKKEITVMGIKFEFAGQLVDNIVYFNESRTKRILMRFEKSLIFDNV